MQGMGLIEEASLQERLTALLRKWIEIIGMITIVSAQLGCFCFFFFYQRKERKVHLLFKDFITTYSSEYGKPSKSLFQSKYRTYKKISEGTKKDEIKTLLGALEEGVVILNEEGEVEQVNHRALLIFNIFIKEVIGNSFRDILKQSSSLGERCLEMIDLALQQKQEIRGHYEEEDNRRFYELIAIPCLEKNKLIFLIQDHSSDHKMLTMGRNFVTNASHELRTPITIIKGFTETLQEIPEISGEMFLDITDKILKNCHRMASVVKGLLVLADLDYSGEATLQPCDLVGLVDSCSYMLLSAHPEVKIETLFNEGESMINGDPDLLELAIMNLFENAVKYSPEPAFITVTVETLSEIVKVSVRDRGIGISSTDRLHVFERFYTVNKSHSRKLGGAGLGLSIVKLIMEKHGGKISVESAVDQGTVFTMQFQNITALKE